MQIINALNVRDENRSIFNRATLRNAPLHLALAGVIALQILAVHLPLGEDIFGTHALTARDWAIATTLALCLLITEETIKLTHRLRAPVLNNPIETPLTQPRGAHDRLGVRAPRRTDVDPSTPST